MMYRCFRKTALLPMFLSWESSASMHNIMVMGFVTHHQIGIFTKQHNSNNNRSNLFVGERIRNKKRIITHHPYSTSTSSTTPPSSGFLSVQSSDNDYEEEEKDDDDDKFLYQAVEYARKGLGHTFPNPAVGCVLVNSNTNEILGAGFHPKAGYPHAEIFALLEGAGHIPSGVEAAQAVIDNNIAATAANNGRGRGNFEDETINDNNDDDQHLQTIQKLTEQYIADENGPNNLFGNCFEDIPVTAYVTLEPCCHYGQTPPCAVTFGLAKVDRIVVGYRDPNPKVDGGGVSILQKSGIDVELSQEGTDVKDACYDLVKSFVKRIIPKEYDDVQYKWMNGAKRAALRSLANTQKREGSLLQINWNGKEKGAVVDEIGVDELVIDTRWIENLDEVLWREELVNLRLNKVVSKKKLAKLLGQRIASQLGAHVVQSVGHTVLLYRPGIPPVLDLEAMMLPSQQEEKTTDDVPSSL